MVQNAGLDRGNVKIVLFDSESVINEYNLSHESRKKNLLRGSFIKKLTKSIAARSNLIKFDTVK